MNEMPEPHEEHEAVHIIWYRHRLLHLVIISVTIALILVFVAMALYTTSGTEQLDVSRPGYQSVQAQVDQSGSFVSFPADGPVNGAVIDEFLELYDKQTSRVNGNDVFLSTALSDEALEIDAP